MPPGPGAGVDHALTELRGAPADLAELGWLDDEPIEEGALADIDATASWLAANQSEVATIVITGPTAAVTAAVEVSGADDATLLTADFDRGAPEPCG